MPWPLSVTRICFNSCSLTSGTLPWDRNRKPTCRTNQPQLPDSGPYPNKGNAGKAEGGVTKEEGLRGGEECEGLQKTDNSEVILADVVANKGLRMENPDWHGLFTQSR